LHNFIVQKYVEKRQAEVKQTRENYQYITPRTLLGIIRLAQGLARLRFNEEVQQDDIDEAIRLTEVSRNTINEEESAEKNMHVPRTDATSSIFFIIREVCSVPENKTVHIDKIRKRTETKGYNEEQLQNCLIWYSDHNILYVSSDGTEVTLL
jgi:DNA replication licensing factor MCM7